MKFSIFSKRISGEERQKILVDLFGERNEYSAFYNGVSIICRMSEFLALAGLLIYLFVAVVGNLSGINYKNAEYVVRNFALQLESNSRSSTELVYTPDADMQFAAFGEGLFVGGNTGVTVFTATGVNTCTSSKDFSAPAVAGSSKYCLIYENGGKKYSVYSLFSEVYYTDTDYPIRGAACADNGYYAIISSAEGYTSAVFVYDNDFALTTKYLFNAYVIDASFSTDGSRIVITTLDTDSQGEFVTVIASYVIGSDGAEYKREVRSSFPLYSKFAGDSVVTLFSDRLQIRTPDGKVSEEVFGEYTAADFSCSGSCAGVLLSDERMLRRSLLLMDTDGSVERFDSAGAVYDVAVVGDRILALTEDGLYASDGNKLSRVSGNFRYGADCVLVPCSGRSLYVAGKSAAYLVYPDKGIEK